MQRSLTTASHYQAVLHNIPWIQDIEEANLHKQLGQISHLTKTSKPTFDRQNRSYAISSALNNEIPNRHNCKYNPDCPVSVPDRPCPDSEDGLETG
jgi:hypothetical protein